MDYAFCIRGEECHLHRRKLFLHGAKTESATDPVAKWASPKVSCQVLRTCPTDSNSTLESAIGGATRVHRPGGRTSPLFFNGTRLTSSPLHAARGSIMVSLLSATEAARAPTTVRSRTRREHHGVSMVTSGSSAVHVLAQGGPASCLGRRLPPSRVAWCLMSSWSEVPSRTGRISVPMFFSPGKKCNTLFFMRK